MLLSTYNLIGYILQRTWSDDFEELEFFQNHSKFSNVEITELNVENPRNNLFKFRVNDSIFVFKQPKFLTSGSTWLIYKEFQFYEEFEDARNFLPSFFEFDKDYNILLMPFLQNLEIPNLLDGNNEVIADEIKDFAINLGKKVAEFHLKLKPNPKKLSKSFIRQISAFHPHYQFFFNSIKLGYKRPQYFDEVVFPIWKNAFSNKKQLYEFFWNTKIYNSLLSFSETWQKNNQYLIHGDLKIENILLEGNVPKFIDFELVALGDGAWDLACLIDSVLHSDTFTTDTPPWKRYYFAYYLIEGYEEINNQPKSNLIERVLKFYALKRLERYKKLNDITSFLFEAPSIEKILVDTDEVVKAFKRDIEKDLDSVHFIKSIFNYHVYAMEFCQ